MVRQAVHSKLGYSFAKLVCGHHHEIHLFSDHSGALLRVSTPARNQHPCVVLSYHCCLDIRSRTKVRDPLPEKRLNYASDVGSITTHGTQVVAFKLDYTALKG